MIHMPPSVPTAEEIERLIQKMRETRERVADNPEEARRILHAAGICTRSGRLKKPYRNHSSTSK
jgi:hypothetical protein